MVEEEEEEEKVQKNIIQLKVPTSYQRTDHISLNIFQEFGNVKQY